MRADRRSAQQRAAKVWTIDGPRRGPGAEGPGATAILDREPEAESAARVLKEIQGGKLKVPMLPAAAQEAAALASDPSVSMQRLTNVIGPDAVLVGKVLRYANSPTYARGTPLTSFRGALQRLGTGALRDILWQAVADAHIFRGADSRWLRAQRTHALAVAHIGRLIARVAGLQAEHLLVAGLLHDLGRLVAKQAAIKARIPGDTLDAVVAQTHSDVGLLVARKWGLPPVVHEAIGRHHSYGSVEDPPYSVTGNLIAAAEAIATQVGYGIDGENVIAAAPLQLGLTEEEQERILDSAKDLFARRGP